MSSLTPYQKLRQVREQIYVSIQEAFSGTPDCEIFITDMGLGLYIRIEERDFKIASELKNGYQKLVLTVMEGIIESENPEKLHLSEIEELKIINEVRPSENFDRPMRGSFIGNSSFHVDSLNIGKEFKIKLLDFINR